MRKCKSIQATTTGEWLTNEDYPDLYEEIWDQGSRYFSREGESGETDLIIVFQDIEDFSRSTDSKTTIDFQRHKDRAFLVVWTINELTNPLGFPIPFSLVEPEEAQKLKDMLKKDHVWVHYLAIEEEQLIHIFSDLTPLPDVDMDNRTQSQNQPLTEEDIEIEIYEKEADKLSDAQLLHMGFGYAIDFSSMISKLGEEASEEKLMTAVHEAVVRMTTHPFPRVRESHFLIWVAEKREQTKDGKDSRLLTIFISSEDENLVDFRGSTEEENPFTTILLTLPEFLVTLQASPIEYGGYPIMEYEAGKLMHIQLNEVFKQRLSTFWNGVGQNPYLQE